MKEPKLKPSTTRKAQGPARYCKESKHQSIEEERAYWQELASALGWQLYGWSYKHSGTYFTNNKSDHTLQLTGYERDTIMNAIEFAKNSDHKES